MAFVLESTMLCSANYNRNYKQQMPFTIISRVFGSAIGQEQGWTAGICSLPMKSKEEERVCAKKGMCKRRGMGMCKRRGKGMCKRRGKCMCKRREKGMCKRRGKGMRRKRKGYVRVGNRQLGHGPAPVLDIYLLIFLDYSIQWHEIIRDSNRRRKLRPELRL